MDVVIGLVIVSLALVALGLVFFFARLKGGDFDHGERLSLLPLREDKEHDAADAAKGADRARHKPEDPKEGGVVNGRG